MLTRHHTRHYRAAGAVYNSPNPHMLLPSLRVRWAWCACLLLAQLVFAADWRSPESQLAAKIAGMTGPSVVSLDLRNLSSLAPSDVDEIRRGLTSALGTSGIQVWQPDQSGIQVRITLSENLQNYIWVAEVRKGTAEPGIAMVSVPRPPATNVAQNAPPLTLHATKLISRSDPILDAEVLDGSPRRLLALSTELAAVYEWTTSQWNMAQVLPVRSDHPLPRDPRGRIVPMKDHLFDAYLPGLICHSANSNPIALECASSDDSWPLQTAEFGLSAFFSPARNFFTGAIVPGIGKQRSAPPFYSAAALPRTNYTLWALSGTDGALHLLDGINQQTLTKVHWGSDIAGVHAPCRQAWQVLATSADSDLGDSVQAFEFPDHEPVAVSQKLNFNGNVTALWTAPDGNSATAVYRDSETGNYEAVQLTLTCGQ
jgi:hypothetical protein